MPSLRDIEDPITLVRVSSEDPSCSSAEMDIRAHKHRHSRSKPRRGITWNEDVYVQETHHINDFTDEEIFLCWFAKRDYVKMKMEFAATVKLISLGKYQGDCETHCARGLEYRSREGSHKRKLNKLTALCAVLDEQERQRLNGDWSDERLSECYIRANAHCRTLSCTLALHDEEEVHGSRFTEPEDEDHDGNGAIVTSNATSTLSRRSRSEGPREQKNPKHGDQEGRNRSKSEDDHRANRLRGFFKRGKDKPEAPLLATGR